MGKFEKPIILILILAFVFRSPAFFKPHSENDEVVYREITRNFTFTLNSYSLKGNPAVSYLPGYIYDYPIFHHPPFFVTALKISALILGKLGLVLPSVLAGVGTVFYVYLIANLLFGEKWVSLSSALIAAIDPVAVMTSLKIWADPILAFFIVATIFHIMRNHKVTVLFAIFGTLTKITYLFVLPAVFLRFIFNKNNRFLYILVSFVALLVFTTWIYIYYAKTGVLLPDVRPTAKFISQFPYVKKTSERPFFFYLVQIPLVNLVIFFSYLYFFSNIDKISFRNIANNTFFVALILTTFIVIMSYFGIHGGVYQLRYITPVFALFPIFGIKFLSTSSYKNIILAFLSCFLFFTLGYNSYLHDFADPISVLWPWW